MTGQGRQGSWNRSPHRLSRSWRPGSEHGWRPRERFQVPELEGPGSLKLKGRSWMAQHEEEEKEKEARALLPRRQCQLTSYHSNNNNCHHHHHHQETRRLVAAGWLKYRIHQRQCSVSVLMPVLGISTDTSYAYLLNVCQHHDSIVRYHTDTRAKYFYS